MHAVTVQSGLQQRWGSHRTILPVGSRSDNPHPKKSQQWLVPRADSDHCAESVGGALTAGLSLRLLR
jgi:hypothetical protein